MEVTSADELRATVLDYLDDPRRLPPVPTVIQEASSMMNDGRSGAADLARVVGRDEAITAQILRIANSAFYGMSGRIRTLSQAITMLGFEQLRILLLGTYLFESRTIRDDRFAACRRAVWRHSMTCAGWAREIAATTHHEPVEEAFIAGLLHDIGKVVLAAIAPAETHDALRLSLTEGLDSVEAERRILGIDHTETGGILAEHWKLPNILRGCISQHHSFSFMSIEGRSDHPDEKLRRVLAIVRVANIASHLFEAAGLDSGDEHGEGSRHDPQILTELVAQVDALLQSPAQCRGGCDGQP